MRIKVKKNKAIGIISLDGDFLSEVNQSDVRQKLLEIIKQGNTQIVIDLTNVKHINSCGLGLLVCALTTLKKVNGDLRLAGVSSDVANLLRMTHLDSIFQMVPTPSVALTDFTAQHN